MGEDLYELPKGWVWVTSSEVCSSVRDGTHDTPKYVEQGIPLITSKNLKENGLDFSTAKNISLEDHQNISVRSEVDKGDILFAMIGTIGNPVIVRTDKVFSIKNVGLFKKNELVINSYYLKYWLSCIVFQKLIENKEFVKGTTQKFIPLGHLRIIDIPLPPLPEQHRIVAEIEELFTQLDAGVELLKKVKAKLKRYRQAVLKAAVEGNLTKEWRTAHQGELEPASVLLECILKQRREKWEAEQLAKMQAQAKTPKDDSWKLKYKEAIAPDTSDLPDLPNGWCWASLEELSWDSRYGTSEKCDYNFSGSPVLRIPNIVDGSIVLDNLKYAANDNKLDAIEPLAYGDLLIIRTNGSKELIGRVALVTQTYDYPYFFASYLIRFRLISIDILPILVNKIWNIFRILTWIETRTATSAGQHNISQTVLNKLPLEVPSLLEQKKIIEEIERIVSVIDQLEKTININIKRAERLRQSILKQAFTGQLVAQDPSDEPAEKLLERIKAEKAKQVTTKTKKKTKSQPQSPTQLALPLD
ncbi:restriction endonuclease subunit S [Nostoc sp.]|uniref:restriction endonuclease subunit S n=1 Tax=Nostoc sp. TaxID=1180 RepID=UPI002FF60EB5